MPFFKNNHDNQYDETSPSRKGSIFSSNRRSPPATHQNQNSSSGIFGHRRSSSASSHSPERRNGNGSSFMGFGRGDHDPTISAARQKVTDAEGAEKAADRALIQARKSVREAKEHVQILEREALEEARRAKAKQAEARVVSKSARGLGRHG